MVALPLFLGPLLVTLIKKLTCFYERIFKRRFSVDVIEKFPMLLTALIVCLSNSFDLLLTEKYLAHMLELSHLSCIFVKYFIGSTDLVLVPLIIFIMDNDIWFGIKLVYKRKRVKSVSGSYN